MWYSPRENARGNELEAFLIGHGIGVKNTHDTHRDIKGNHGGKDGHDLVSLNELYIALTLLNLPFTLKAFC